MKLYRYDHANKRLEVHQVVPDLCNVVLLVSPYGDLYGCQHGHDFVTGFIGFQTQDEAVNEAVARAKEERAKLKKFIEELGGKL